MWTSLFSKYRPWWQLALLALATLGGCSSPPEVRTVTVTKQSVEATVASVTSGTVRAEKVAELAFGAVGRVKSLHVKLGDRVRAGQLLAELENDDLRATFVTATAELKRREYLRSSQLLSEAEVEQFRRDVDAARVALEKSTIVAPYDGLIAELNLEVGQLSQITAVIPKALIRIVDLDPRYVRAEIDEVDLSKVKLNQSARIRILAVRSEPYPAVVRKVVPFVSSIREQDRTSEIELRIDAGDELLPVGASADVEIIIDRHDGVLAIPARAVLGRGNARYVYTLQGERAHRSPISLGISNYDIAEVTQGLREGERVIIPAEGFEVHDDERVRERE